MNLDFVRETAVPTVSQPSWISGRQEFSPNPVDDVAQGRFHRATLSYQYSNTRWRSWTRTLLDAEARIAGGALGGDYEYVRWELNGVRSQRIFRRIYLDSRLRAGLATGALPLQEEFYAGGPGTMPGFADREFSGNRTLLLNVSLSVVPFMAPEKSWQFRMFSGIDAGNAWRSDRVLRHSKTEVRCRDGYRPLLARQRLPFPERNFGVMGDADRSSYGRLADSREFLRDLRPGWILMRTGGFGNRLSSTRCAGRLLGRALRVLFACIIVAGAMDGTASAATYQLDSLSYQSDDTMLYIDFLLPMAALKSKELQAALDDNGLTIECVISIEVQRSQKFGSEVVSKKPILRTIKYSKWYNEYNLEEGVEGDFHRAPATMNR